MNSQENPIQPIALKPKRRIPKWLRILLIVLILPVLLVIAFFAITWFSVNNGTKDAMIVSNNFINSLQAKNINELNNLTSREFKKFVSEQQLVGIVDKASPVIQGEEVVVGRNIESSTNNSTKFKITYKVKTSDGDKLIYVNLAKDDQDWKVLNFEL